MQSMNNNHNIVYLVFIMCQVTYEYYFIITMTMQDKYFPAGDHTICDSQNQPVPSGAEAECPRVCPVNTDVCAHRLAVCQVLALARPGWTRAYASAFLTGFRHTSGLRVPEPHFEWQPSKVHIPECVNRNE